MNNGEQKAQFLSEEYSALRGEMLKRVDIQHQLISLTLIASGTFLTFGIQGIPTIALLYPIFAMFLAAAWSQSDIRIHQMGGYIRDCIEAYFLENNLGWEHARATSQFGSIKSLSVFASRGIFIGTQLLSVSLVLPKTTFPIEDILLFLLDFLVIGFTVYLLIRRPETIKA